MYKKDNKINGSLNIIIVLIILKIFYVISNHEKRPGIIYILSWSGGGDEPAKWWSKKHKSLIDNNCKFQNCYIVQDRDYFLDETDYDAILFNVAKLGEKLPSKRSDNQFYVFVAMEPSPYWPVNDEKYNWFFNYTFSYRLDSDVVYPYFIVKDIRGKVVGPRINAHWRNVSLMRPTKESIKDKLKNKTIAAAWFVTNCYGYNKRLSFAHAISRALGKYNLTIDIYGRCGDKVCLKDQIRHCLGLVEKNYYFYFAFENSNCEDYVTEKLMIALDHYAVPVVVGGANYSRFLPDGTYLNGNSMSEEEVAAKMNEAIQDKQKYYDYFKWHRYYTYHQSQGGDTDPLCAFCAFLNDESIRNQRRVYARFDKWWNEFITQNDAEDIIEKYEDSGPYIKSVLTYREPKFEPKTVETLSTWEQANSILDDVINYFFPP